MSDKELLSRMETAHENVKRFGQYIPMDDPNRAVLAQVANALTAAIQRIEQAEAAEAKLVTACKAIQYAVNRLDADKDQPQVSGDLSVALAALKECYMSCQHGNHVSACDLCDEVDAAWERGYNAALKAAANKAIYLRGCSATYIAEEIRALNRHQPQSQQSPQGEK